MKNHSTFWPDYSSAAARQTAVTRAAQKPLSALLLGAIRETNALLPSSARREQNLAALERAGTTVVITGQQVGLFLGPLFTLYKALSAVRAAAHLESERGERVVPIFWLQTEDHDFAEINHTFFPAASGELLRIAVGSSPELPARVPVSERVLGAQVREALTTIRAHYITFPHAEEFLRRVEASYQPGRTFAQAFALLLDDLLHEDGLVFFDPRHPNISTLAAPLFQRMLHEQPAVTRTLREQAQTIHAQGEQEQVHVRDHSPLFFFHDASHQRFRLVEDGAFYRLAGSAEVVARAELERLLAESPERFSTSALLRPLLQDTLFPTAAYVAGEAELGYHEQIAPLYGLLGLEPHLLVPRLSFLCVDEKARKLLAQLELSPQELALPDAELFERCLANLEAGLLTPEQVEAYVLLALEEPFLRLSESFDRVDRTLTESLKKTEERIAGLVEALKNRYLKALLERDRVAQGRITRLRSFLYPNGVEQERCFSPLHFLALYGADFLRRLRVEGDVFGGTKTELAL